MAKAIFDGLTGSGYDRAGIGGDAYYGSGRSHVGHARAAGVLAVPSAAQTEILDSHDYEILNKIISEMAVERTMLEARQTKVAPDIAQFMANQPDLVRVQ